MPRPTPPIIAAAVGAALLGLAVLAPAVMDWNRLRPEIEAAASAALGREVTVSGPISVRLLPSPTATMGGLTVGDASAQSLRIGLRLLPLLAGRREIDELILTGGKAGPVEGIEARLSPAGTISATGRAPLPGGGTALLAFDGVTDFKTATGKLHLTSALLTMDGTMTLSPDEASLPDMTITLGQSRATANIVAALGTSPILIDATIKAGALDLDTDAAPQAATPRTTVPEAPAVAPQTQATPPAQPNAFTLPRDIVANLVFTADSLRWRGIPLNRIEISALLDNGILSLSHASLQAPGDAHIGLSGALTAKEGRPAFDGNLRATTSRAGLSSPVNLRGSLITLPSLALAVDDIHATGEVAITLEPPLGLKARLSALGLEAGFDGRLDGARVSGLASLRGASFAQAARLVSGSYRPRGAGPLAITAHLDAEGDGLAFNQLQARLGETMLGGQGTLAWGASPRLAADLTSTAIALAPFLPAESKPLGLQAWRLDKASVHLTRADGVTTVDRLSGRLLGGDLTGSAKLAAAGVTAAIAIQGADLGGLGLGTGGVRATKGRLDGQARLSISGQQLATLAGDGRFEVKDGVVEGFDLAAMDARMRRLENLGSLLGLVQAGLSGGSSRFSSLTASFRAERGVVTSRDIKLEAEGGGATGTAIVDLPKDTIDARFAFKLATPDSPPLGLRLEGKLGAPNKAIDVNALQRYLVEHGLGKALKDKGRGLIESLLGGKPREKR